MTHYVNYTLTYNYCGRLPIEAFSTKEAEDKVSKINPELLRGMSSESKSTIQVKGEATQNELQLSIFTEEEDDGN